MSLIIAASPPAGRRGIFYASLCQVVSPAVFEQNQAPPELRAGLFFLAAVLIELADVGPQIGDLLLVGDAHESHFGARNHGLGVFDVLLESVRLPNDARFLVGVGIGVIRDAPGLAAVEAIELRAEHVLGVLTDLVAGPAQAESLLALGGVLRGRRGGRSSY